MDGDRAGQAPAWARLRRLPAGPEVTQGHRRRAFKGRGDGAPGWSPGCVLPGPITVNHCSSVANCFCFSIRAHPWLKGPIASGSPLSGAHAAFCPGPITVHHRPSPVKCFCFSIRVHPCSSVAQPSFVSRSAPGIAPLAPTCFRF